MSATEPQPKQLSTIDLSDATLARLTVRPAETAERHDRTAEFPWEPINARHIAGVLRFGVPQEFGGQPITVTRPHALERHLRDVLCCRIHPPQGDGR